MQITFGRNKIKTSSKLEMWLQQVILTVVSHLLPCPSGYAPLDSSGPVATASPSPPATASDHRGPCPVPVCALPTLFLVFVLPVNHRQLELHPEQMTNV